MQNELKNGFGNIKEYNYLGNLLYEGQYSLGKRWNGKMFNNKGEIEFELKNGCGNGKEYGFSNDLIYEGNYVDGYWEGMGKEFNGSKIIYEGEYYRGNRHGKGKEYSKYGQLILEGYYIYGKLYKGEMNEYYGEELNFEVKFDFVDGRITEIYHQ